jgi:NAD(P)-dependent dehydrogenase (short-subunit alcohol dehydrogenase family)
MTDSNGAGGEQRVVLVTGASSGIGQAIAGHLARQGWRVFGTSRSGAALGAPGVEMIALDVDDDGSVERGMAIVLSRAGRLDAVVNNAGWAIMGAVEDTSIAGSSTRRWGCERRAGIRRRPPPPHSSFFRLSFSQYSSRFLISRSKPRSIGR